MLLEGGEVIDKSCGELYRDRSRYSGEEERERQRWICIGLEALKALKLPSVKRSHQFYIR
jgi:hypothetical protein